MPIFEYLGILFEWHDPKFELVNSERGYALEEIASVFDDDYSVTIDDIGGDYGEQRLLTTGISNKFRLVTVSWVERGDTIRIITAFNPSKEQKGDMTMQSDNKTTPQDVLDTIRYYEELDTTNFPDANPSVLQKLRQRKEFVKQFTQFLDSETIEILTQHNTKQDYKRLENIIKAIYAPV